MPRASSQASTQRPAAGEVTSTAVGRPWDPCSWPLSTVGLSSDRASSGRHPSAHPYGGDTMEALRMPTSLQASGDLGGAAWAEWLSRAARAGRGPDCAVGAGASASRSSRAATARGSRRAPTPTDARSCSRWRGDTPRRCTRRRAWPRSTATGRSRCTGSSTCADGGADSTDATAMLLERCRPGTELRGRPEAEQHVVITDLLRSVWAVDLPRTTRSVRCR